MKNSIIILGLGKSGIAACKLAISKGMKVIAIDEKKSIEFATQNENSDIEFYLGGKLPQDHNAKFIVISPGIPRNSKLAKFAENLNLPIYSELQFAANFSQKPLIALTGTNGKTTTTELCSHILNHIGTRSSATGNTGFPISEAVMIEDEYDVHVVEVSSFQLEASPDFKPSVATILNISSDHMDRYSNFDEYEDTKFKIFKNLPKQNISINTSLINAYKKRFGNQIPLTFSSQKNPDADIFANNGSIFLKTNQNLFELTKIPDNLPGRHNAENITATISLLKIFFGKNFDSNKTKIAEAINSFKIGKHRLELVAIENGIKYFNDSKATNPDSTIAAINSLAKGKNIRLILGGLDKNMDFSAILTKKKHIKKAYITGQCKEKLFSLLKNEVVCALLKNFECAVDLACKEAEPGDIVLMSPACASMDEFKNYQERGNKFIEIIKRRLSK